MSSNAACCTGRGVDLVAGGPQPVGEVADAGRESSERGVEWDDGGHRPVLPGGRRPGWRTVSECRLARSSVTSALGEAGAPVWATDGRNGGYRLQRAVALPPLTFTTGEATAGAFALAAEPDLPFGSDGRTALAKVVGAMGERQRQEAREFAQRIFMRGPDRSRDPRWADALDEALRARMVVNLDYRSRDGPPAPHDPSNPRVRPHRGTLVPAGLVPQGR